METHCVQYAAAQAVLENPVEMHHEEDLCKVPQRHAAFAKKK